MSNKITKCETSPENFQNLDYYKHTKYLPQVRVSYAGHSFCETLIYVFFFPMAATPNGTDLQSLFSTLRRELHKLNKTKQPALRCFIIYLVGTAQTTAFHC